MGLRNSRVLRVSSGAPAELSAFGIFSFLTLRPLPVEQLPARVSAHCFSRGFLTHGYLLYMRPNLPNTPRCPIHVAVRMIPVEPEIKRGHRYGKLANLKKKISEELRSRPRWKCAVEGCHCCQVTEISI